MKRILSTRLNIALLVGIVGLLGLSLAAPPPAGVPIGNQAVASYEVSGVPYTVSSNIVYVMVQAVPDVLLEDDGTRVGAPGSPVSIPHTLTNTGNVADSYDLEISNVVGQITAGNIQIFLDANNDGVPDNNTPITEIGPLAPGQSIGLVVVTTLPANATGTQTYTITATSQSDGTVWDDDNDTINVTMGAVIVATKAVSPSSGPAGTTGVQYTIAYTNDSTITATNLVITDLLPQYMTYVADSGRWSGSGATVLDDAAGGDPTDIEYDYDVTATGTVTATIASVGPGVSGTISFRVDVDADAPAGVVNNVATTKWTYGEVTTPLEGTTNVAPFTVLKDASLTFEGDTVTTIPQGGLVKFKNTLTNTGNATDTFNIEVAAPAAGQAFPAGSVFTLISKDNATPLLDTNGDGIPDTGPVPAGGTYDVWLWVQLPAGYTGVDAVTGDSLGSWLVDKWATSTNDPSVKDDATDTLETIVPSKVDLTNDSATGGGVGPGPEETPVNTEMGTPGGAPVTFSLWVTNEGSGADSWNLSVGSTAAGAALPAGVTVVFLDGTTPVTNTGTIAAGASKEITAQVTIAAGVTASPINLYFRVTSPVTGSTDVKWDEITLPAMGRKITIQPDLVGQLTPGGSKEYTHTITNHGSVTEGGTASDITLATADNTAGFSSVIYWDTNGNGILDDGDDLLTDGLVPDELAAGESRTFFVVVYASPSVALGVTNTTTISATTTGGTGTEPPVDYAYDLTTTVPADLTVVKEQSLDGGATWTKATLDVEPGATVSYRITVLNRGPYDVEKVKITDQVPSYTTIVVDSYEYSVAGGAATAATLSGSVVSTPEVALLSPGQTVVLWFDVTVNQ